MKKNTRHIPGNGKCRDESVKTNKKTVLSLQQTPMKTTKSVYVECWERKDILSKTRKKMRSSKLSRSGTSFFICSRKGGC